MAELPLQEALDRIPTDYNDFLAFMTFAARGGGMGCECCDDDECGTPASASASAVPPDIRDAVDEHKNSRKRKLSNDNPSVFEGRGSYNIRQNRELVKREDGFSIWRLDLPVCAEDNGGGGGDPIVEYRNNHRIIFVEKLNKETSHVLSIGQGIIGSAAEEKTRKRVHWESGSSYLLPCSKGIACGWIHKPATAAEDTENEKSDNITSTTTTTTTTTSSTTRNAHTEDVVIYSLKVSPETLLGMKNKNLDQDVSCWVKLSYELFQQRLAKLSQLQTQDDGGAGKKKENLEDVENVTTDDISLSEEESMAMSLIIELAK